VHTGPIRLTAPTSRQSPTLPDVLAGDVGCHGHVERPFGALEIEGAPLDHLPLRHERQPAYPANRQGEPLRFMAKLPLVIIPIDDKGTGQSVGRKHIRSLPASITSGSSATNLSTPTRFRLRLMPACKRYRAVMRWKADQLDLASNPLPATICQQSINGPITCPPGTRWRADIAASLHFFGQRHPTQSDKLPAVHFTVSSIPCPMGSRADCRSGFSRMARRRVRALSRAPSGWIILSVTTIASSASLG